MMPMQEGQKKQEWVQNWGAHAVRPGGILGLPLQMNMQTRPYPGLRGADCRRRHSPSEQAFDLLRVWVQVDVVEAGPGGQSGHGAHLEEGRRRG